MWLVACARFVRAFTRRSSATPDAGRADSRPGFVAGDVRVLQGASKSGRCEKRKARANGDDGFPV